jgi:predicted metal-dependent phosphoesterase TrpH
MMVERLRELGYPVSIERVREIAGEGALGRPHVARALIEIGAVDSLNAAFDTFLGHGRPAFVDKQRFRIDEVVELVHGAGGISSIAHPTVYPDHRRLVKELLDAGIDGIETRHPDVDPENRDYYERLASDRGLFVTGGSDDHGNGGPKTIGSILVPESLIHGLLDRLDS